MTTNSDYSDILRYFVEETVFQFLEGSRVKNMARKKKGKIGRVIFCVVRGRMVLLHGFVKKTRKTPAKDMELALKRMKEVE